MKGRVGQIMLLAAALVAAYGAWTWLFPGPEKVIANRLGQVRKLVSIAPNESPIAKLANTDRLLDYFSPDLRISLNIPGRQELEINNREDLRQIVMGARAQLSSLKVQFHDPQILVAPDRASASSLVTVRVDGATAGEPFIERVRFSWIKSDGKWLISGLERAPVLR